MRLNLPDGVLLGMVNKLSAGSKYEIKTPDGIAGVKRGQDKSTRYNITVSDNRSLIVASEGIVVFLSSVPAPQGSKPPPAAKRAHEQEVFPKEGKER